MSLIIFRYKQNIDRAGMIKEWHEEGGVMILGYDMFRNLSNETTRIRKKQREIFQTALINPGADLVVCDEGHLLKNAKTSLSKAVNRIQTRRRIVLTGTPLQNNLNECNSINSVIKLECIIIIVIIIFVYNRLLYGSVCETKLAGKIQ